MYWLYILDSWFVNHCYKRRERWKMKGSDGRKAGNTSKLTNTCIDGSIVMLQIVRLHAGLVVLWNDTVVVLWTRSSFFPLPFCTHAHTQHNSLRKCVVVTAGMVYAMTHSTVLLLQSFKRRARVICCVSSMPLWASHHTAETKTNATKGRSN